MTNFLIGALCGAAVCGLFFYAYAMDRGGD